MPLTSNLKKPGPGASYASRLVVLDRDGVINEDSPDYIKSPQEWHAIPGSLEAIARLNHAGWRVIVASNQSGLARGLFDFEALGSVHDKMQRLLAELGGRIDGIFFCPHGPDDGCECRKPKPGLLKDIGRRLQVDMQGVPVIGDSPRDLQAARQVKALPILVRTGNGARSEDEVRRELPEAAVYDDLEAAVSALLDGRNGQANGPA